MKRSQLYRWFKRATILLFFLMLLISGCKPVLPEPAPLPPPPPPPNKPPIINYITAQQQTTPSYSSEIRCVASDADDDILTYSWAVEGGKIEGSGDTVVWTAPETEGDYTITATVSDGNGGEATDSVTITVISEPNQLPIVTMIVTLKDREPITAGEAPIRIKRFSTVQIECIAEDPDGDELTFTWAATEGKVMGEGAKVDYFASDPGDQAVTVTAIDSRNGQTKFSVYFDVPCCGAF